MKTINVGVVGVGAMGENHVRVYHKMEKEHSKKLKRNMVPKVLQNIANYWKILK